ncbi:MAG: MBL fold metallo-hydrolase [Methanospirillaceae archaeon]|nr:MBL fold metallo-hydrolase [Methanospirillaceae archaeon]
MIIKQFFIPGIAHYSYLIGDASHCAIVDPTRDCERYIIAAEELGLQITAILETHLHADFVSGHRDLQRKTSAPIYAPKTAACAFDHIPVSEGEKVDLGNLSFQVYETPGHTPEHVCYALIDKTRGEKPVAVFTGDTLLVGDVGRPDLFPGRAEELASSLFVSLHTKLLTLPDYCEVYPAHGAGSLCGRALSQKNVTTIGYERRHNQALLIPEKNEFVRYLTTDMPPAPDHFARCSLINRQGPALLAELSPVSPLSPDLVSGRKDQGAVLLDCRRYDAFGGMHIPGSYHIDSEGNFSTFAGWVVPSDKEIVLVLKDADQAPGIATWLYRVGLDTIAGFLAGGIQKWALSGRETVHLPIIAPHRIAEQHPVLGGRIRIIDIRDAGEFLAGHVPGAENIRFPDIRNRYDEFSVSDTIIVYCGTGIRSSIIASLLLMQGFSNAMHVAGGFSGYRAAGLPVVTGVTNQ